MVGHRAAGAVAQVAVPRGPPRALEMSGRTCAVRNPCHHANKANMCAAARPLHGVSESIF